MNDPQFNYFIGLTLLKFSFLEPQQFHINLEENSHSLVKDNDIISDHLTNILIINSEWVRKDLGIIWVEEGWGCHSLFWVLSAALCFVHLSLLFLENIYLPMFH